jgi:hypothetical protein
LPSSPFGAAARGKLLRQHFNEAGSITPANAWRFIYRELLWIDGSTGLAHLYESDKAQPGRTWYSRTTVFTDMICERFGHITHEELKEQIDKLFRACLEQLIKSKDTLAGEKEIVEALTSFDSSLIITEEITDIVEANEELLHTSTAYVPDVDLVAEFATMLATQANMAQPQAEIFARQLVARARFYFTVERKRQNILGEGFEDLLQMLMIRVGQVPQSDIIVRQRANTLPGFQSPTTRERIEAPDIAIVKNNRTELLASVKWSLRHDRQKQLSDELDCYVELLSQERFPTYVLITNEYDPGRLVNTDGLARRGQKIDRIYHINLELLLGALYNHERIKDLKPLIQSTRLRSVEDFLNDLREQYRNKP